MDVKFINSFIRSTQRVFIETVNIPLNTGQPYVKEAKERIYKLFQLSAMIEIIGPEAGKIILSLSEPVGLAIASGLLGSPVNRHGARSYDAIRKLTTMIVGDATKDFPTDGPTSIAIPKIVRTEEVIYPTDWPVLAIPLDTTVGRLLLQIAMGLHRGS